MPFDVLLLVGVAIGLILVSSIFVLGRRDRSQQGSGTAAAAPDPATNVELAGSATPQPEESQPIEAHEDAAPSTEAALLSLTETVAALRALAELKAEDLALDEPPSETPEPEPVEASGWAAPETATKVLQPERATAAQRIAELKDQELERDTAEREGARTGWRPVSPGGLRARVPATATGPVDKDAWAAPAARVQTTAVDTPPLDPEPELPAIVTKVSEVQLDPSTKMHPESAAKLRSSVGQAFTPAAPVSRRDLFAGREEQLETLVDVVFERGQHAIVYGERGVGKTSLASILTLVFVDEPGKLPLRINCDAADDYDSLWRKVIDELEAGLDELDQEVPLARKALERALRKDKLSPTDVARVLKQVAPYVEAIVIIDEFDTCSSEQATRYFADTIKTLSDQLVPATLILLGIADSLDELLAEHASVSRALVHVHMPRMAIPELKDIVKRGLDQLTMDIEDDALDLIARLSQGFPHFTHLIGQAATRSAIDAERPLVTLDDVNAAATKISGRIETWIQDAYEKATVSSHDSIYAQVLLASALAPIDRRGYFAAADVRAPMTAIMGKPYDIPSFIRQLNALSEDDRGPVLVKTGTERKHRYRFVEPQMEPYVIIRSLSEGLIQADLLGTLTAAEV